MTDNYNDCDDRYLAEFEEEQEALFMESHVFMNEDIHLPLFVIDGVPYYG